MTMNSIYHLTSDFSSRDPTLDYEIMQRIGAGTYGEVYKARHIHTASMRALKMVKLETGDDLDIIKQEILMMKQCRHPNIVAYFESYYKTFELWIAMELCSGGSMQDIYHAYGPLSETQIAYVIGETLRGLDYLHKNGKMHRDIKGANILLTNDGDVKLADFGIAATLTSTIGKRKSFIGTPYWMAPEVAAVERKGGYNHLCDIWAVGITAIEFAELQPPMFDLHPMRALVVMSKSGFKPPTLKNKSKWSSLFQNFLKSTLVKSPKKRPSAEHLLEHRFLKRNLTSQITKDLLERVRNGQISRKLVNDPDDDDDDDDVDEDNGNIFQVSQKITSSNYRSSEASSSVASNMHSAILNDSLLTDDDSSCDSNNDLTPSSSSSSIYNEDIDNAKSIEQLKSIGVAEEDIYELMKKLPLKAFANLAADEIRHIVEVMREADVDDSEDFSNENNTIKRAPTSKHDDDTDPNNNSLKHNESIPSNGIPSVPQVLMGAGFMKIFNGCPLEIHTSYSWLNDETKCQYVLIATDEGIYSLNLSALHDATLELLFPRRTIWLYVTDNILWSISGKSNHLYRHDLAALVQTKQSARITLSWNKLTKHSKLEKLMMKRVMASTKIWHTRGCIRCCVGRNHYDGLLYLAGLLTDEIFLMQYDENVKKFLHLKSFSISIPMEIKIFQMISIPENPQVSVCIGVAKTKSWMGSFKFIELNFESEKLEKFNDDLLLTDVSHVIQDDKDIGRILISQGRNVSVVNTDGRPFENSQMLPKLCFNYEIESLVCLRDSVLIFHKHGMQGRSLKDNEITQEIYDETRIFRVIGNDHLVVLQSRPHDLPQSFHGSATASSDLHILMGHENTQYSH